MDNSKPPTPVALPMPNRLTCIPPFEYDDGYTPVYQFSKIQGCLEKMGDVCGFCQWEHSMFQISICSSVNMVSFNTSKQDIPRSFMQIGMNCWIRHVRRSHLYDYVDLLDAYFIPDITIMIVSFLIETVD
jgi:hypothetical protein